MNIAISRAGIIAAADVITPKGDVRYYLNGILFEKHPGKGVVIVTTDGHRLLACYDEAAEVSDDMPDQVIIRFDKAAIAMARKVSSLDLPVFIRGNDDDSSVSVDIGGTTFSNGGEILDGKFPNWRQICPTYAGDGAPACFNAKYLADWSPICKYLTANAKYQSITIRAENKASSAAVFFKDVDYAFGIVMPMRDDSPAMASIPAWAK